MNDFVIPGRVEGFDLIVIAKEPVPGRVKTRPALPTRPLVFA